MPRKRNVDPSIPGEPRYRLHKRSRQAIVTLSGRDHYLGPYGSPASHDRYRVAVAEWVARGRRPAEAAAVPLSVAEICRDYLAWAQGWYLTPDGQPNEKEIWHVRRVLRVLRESFGLTPAIEFGPRKLEVVRDVFVAQGLTRASVNRYTGRVKHVFKWATAKELLPPSVWHGLQALDGLRRGRTTARETEPVAPVADDRIDAIRPHVSSPVWAMIELQRLTGMRPGEACIMRGVDIDRSGELWTYKPERHKTQHHGRERTIMIGPKAQEILRPFLRPGYCFSPQQAERERRTALSLARKTPLSCGNRPGTNRKRRPRRQPGERYTAESYAHAIKYACAKVWPYPGGLTRDERREWRRRHWWGPNRIRHTYGTAVRRAFGLDVAQVALGHAHARITEVYAERDLQRAAEVALKIG